MATGLAPTPPGTGVLKDERAGCPHRPRDHLRATHRRHPDVGPARLRLSMMRDKITGIPPTCPRPGPRGREVIA